MMTAKRKAAKTGKKSLARKSSAGAARSEDGRTARKKISATERWMLISKNVYGRAQRRGFVGGDPLEDLSEAVREVDEHYATDVQGLLALTDPAEMIAQFRNLFAGYGLGQRSLERLLDRNRDAVERLAESNRQSRSGRAERINRRRSLLQDVAGEAMRTLQSFARGNADRDIQFMRQPTQAVGAVLSRLTELANSAAELAAGGNGDRDITGEPGETPEEVAIHDAVVKAYRHMSALDLADAPIAALKGVSDASGKKLEAAFRLHSIRDMGTSPLFERAQGVVDLADAGRGGLLEMVDGAVSGLDGISARQAKVLADVFHVRTVRDFAENRFFHVARAIVHLADSAGTVS